MAILIGLAVVLMLGSAIFYNKLRAKVYGVIGVGGSYMALIGMAMLCALIVSLFGGKTFSSTMEVIIGIIFMVIGVGYLVYVMIVRCNTVMERVLLPIIAVMIAMGFCWRLLFSLLLHVPMSSGAPEKATFPASLTDDQGENWYLLSDSGDHADYQCRKTGERRTFWYTGDYVKLPHGWRAN